MSLTIAINGEPMRLDAPLSVKALLERLGLDPLKVAVERNLEIVPRSTFDAVSVGADDQIEIVHFVGGG